MLLLTTYFSRFWITRLLPPRFSNRCRFEVFGGLYVAHVDLAKRNIVTEQRPCKIRIPLMRMDMPTVMIGGGTVMRHATKKMDRQL